MPFDILKIFPTKIYDHYSTKSLKLYRNLETNLSHEWTEKKLKTKRKRRYKPTNFKVLYKKLYFLRSNLTKQTKLNWNSNSNEGLNPSFYIKTIDSRVLRPINNSLLYTSKALSYYKFRSIKGFTFDQEKILDKKRSLLHPKLTYYKYQYILKNIKEKK